MSVVRTKKGVRSTQKAVADRHLEIRGAAERGQGDLVGWIQDRFGFSRKTAQRDLKAIKAADPAWWKANVHEKRGLVNGRSGADGHTPERPALEQALPGVVVLEKLTGGLLSIAARDTRRAAIHTERLLTAEDERSVQRLRRFIQLRHQPARVTPVQVEAFHAMVQAHLLGRSVEISYTGSDEPSAPSMPSADGKARKAAPRRRIGPVCLFHAKRAWYVLARVLDGKGKGELRQFKLARIQAARPAPQPFQAPADFSLDDHLAGAWELFRREGPAGAPRQVVIDFSAAFARNIEETLWHNTQSIERLRDGGVRFTATVGGFDEILWWVLQMGAGAVVVEPPELRRLVCEELERTRRLYD